MPAFERCERIVTAQLQAQAQAQQQASQRKGGAPPGIHFPDMDRDFVISSLDLVSGLAEGLGPSIHGLLAHSQLRSMVLQCCRVRPALPDLLLCPLSALSSLGRSFVPVWTPAQARLAWHAG